MRAGRNRTAQPLLTLMRLRCGRVPAAGSVIEISRTSGRSRLGARRRKQEEILRLEAKRFLLPDNKFMHGRHTNIRDGQNGKIIPIYKTFTFVGANRSARPNKRVIMALILKEEWWNE